MFVSSDPNVFHAREQAQGVQKDKLVCLTFRTVCDGETELGRVLGHLTGMYISVAARRIARCPGGERMQSPHGDSS